MKKIILLLILFYSCLAVIAQDKLKYECSINAGIFTYLAEYMYVDSWEPGFQKSLPNEATCGCLVTFANGICLKEKFHLGLGAGFGRIEKINGVMLFADLIADFTRKPTAMFAYFNPGYSHFWNPYYENGTGSGMLDFGLGVRWKEMLKGKILFSAGLLCLQGNGYFSAKVGYTF